MRNRLCLGLIPLAFAAGCTSLPGRNTTASGGAATPVIPAPVPVTVGPLREEIDAATQAAQEAEPALGGAEELVGQIPEFAEHGDLLLRVRAGMALGTHYNSRIDREANWFAANPDYVERVFGRAAPYLHYIVNEVEARGLPQEIALLPFIESAFQPYAYSRARAAGLWQFMAATGNRFSMKQDWWYDGRRDVVAATQGALDYLTYLHDMFDGNWLHAIAAYNCGEGNVRKAIRRNRAAGKRTDFWNLKLPAETRGYVPRLLAMSRIVAEPEKYGLSIEGIPDTPYFEQVETGGQISIEVAAELAGVTTEQMYDLNPAYHRWATDPTGPHMLLVPVESAEAFRDSLLQLTPDQRLRVERYTVRDGDTLAAVAQRFGTTLQHLRELNELGNTGNVATGAELRVPSAVASLPENVRKAAARVDSRSRQPVRAVHVVRRGDTLSAIAARHGISAQRLASLNHIKTTSTLRVGQRLRLNSGDSVASGTVAAIGGATTVPTAAAAIAGNDDGRQVTYVVRRGDTLSGIARTLKVTVGSLREWNNISGSDIRPGQRLVAFVSRGT